MENYINKFIDRLGEPSSIEKLLEYINFCLQNNFMEDKDTNEHIEIHHLYPRSKFPEYISENDFLIKLKYLDHVKAHLLLSEAYPIRCFLRTLNFMPLDMEQYELRKLLTSIAAKKSFKELKQNVEKYNEYIRKKSLTGKLLMQPDNEVYIRIQESIKRFNESDAGKLVNISRSKKLLEYWDNLTEEEYENRCSINKAVWDNLTEEEYKKRVAAAAARYKDEEFNKKFIKTMTIVNKDEEKRKSAGKTIKNLWESEEYRKNVMIARKAVNDKLKEDGIKRSNSSKIKDKWNDPIWKESMLLARAEARKRKLNETN